MYNTSCGWCHKQLREEEVALIDEKLFHSNPCLAEYINYCRMIRELCLKEMKGAKDVFH